MQKTLISLYGGTRLQQSDIDFVGDLVGAFLAYPDVVLVSGGFWHWTKDKNIKETSVDLATLIAVEKYVNKTGESVESRLKTWRPETNRAEVVRYTEGDVEDLKGSPRARRFQLVQRVDALVTIKGKHAATILELALALDKPALPIGFTGGASAVFWQEDREHFIKYFEMSGELANQLDTRPSSESASKSLAEQVAKIVLRKAERRCLVLMDFGVEHTLFYDYVIAPAITNAGFVPYRIDRDEGAGNITKLFSDALDKSVAIVVDITGLNPNVMYELGYIHSRDEVSPVIVTRDEIETQDIPFYLRQHMVIAAGNDMLTVQKGIEQHLKAKERA